MKQLRTRGPVRRELVGDNGPSVRSGRDPAILGRAALSPTTAVEARSFQTFRITYTVGKLGIDDTGAIRIAFRFISDAGHPQIHDPMAPNYVTASSNGEGRLILTTGAHGQRPWNSTITIAQSGGYLKEGDVITVVLGDTRRGSPGMLMQTFHEEGYEFRVSADVQATGNFVPLPEQLWVPIVAGPAHCWKAVLPTLRRPGQTFHLGLKAEDVWGNPTSQARGRIRLEPSLPVTGLPAELDYAPEDRALVIEGLSVAKPGVLRIRLFVDGREAAEAGPLVIRDSATVGYWGDLHGQTGETVGINSIESYFDFARNKSFLDVSSHQGNDFQINTAFWAHLNSLTKAVDEPGRFVAIPGYEWSGNTAVGGDHNVFFRHEGRTIHRCSHALLEDTSDLDTDANTLTDLYARLADEDCVLYAHVGGRYANIHYDHDARLETAVEMHSAWGSFEWILTDGFPLRRRVGVVCNSDGHKGRPGASYPGSSTFGAYGGLTCFLTDRLDRDAIFEAMRRRHHYGTTGCRMHMDVTAHLPGGGTRFARNPATMPDCDRSDVDRVMMGDIVRVSSRSVDVSVGIVAHAGIERVELRAGRDVLETIRPYDRSELGQRIRVLWSGAEYRGRGRNTLWRGRAQFEGNAIARFATINRWNPERLFEQRGSDTVVFDTVTTGNFMGFDAWLADGAAGTLALATSLGNLETSIADIGLADIMLDAGGLQRKLRTFRLPDAPLAREISFTRSVDIAATGDTPIWICVTTEDGYQAWSSPIYVFRD